MTIWTLAVLPDGTEVQVIPPPPRPHKMGLRCYPQPDGSEVWAVEVVA
jgi:hypothetical protein